MEEAFDGTHPMCGHEPPNQRRSTIGDGRTELAGLVGGRLAGRAGADDDEVERVHADIVPDRSRDAALPSVAPRCRLASYSRTAAAIETLRLSATPSIGRRTGVTPSPDQASVRPAASLPSTIATRAPEVRVGVGGGAVDACGHDPHARRAQPVRTAALDPAATGTAKIVPSDARIAFGLNRSVRGSAAMTASAPAPSALRSTAPRLPGFSTPSTTTTSGSAGSATGRRARCPGCATTATTPSARSP